MPRLIPTELIERIASSDTFTGFEKDFFRRVWTPGLGVYEKRLDALGFRGKKHVLDCGFGMAQWMVCLADANTKVSGLEYEASRVAAAKAITEGVGIRNVELTQGSSEALPYPDATFDAVFCYGVLFLTDLRKSLDELRRVMAPGAELYFTMNGVGWFLFLVVEEHNKSPHYDPRTIGADALALSLDYFRGGPMKAGKQLATPREVIHALLTERGFRDIEIATEAGLAQKADPSIASFYKHQTYLGHDCVYEIRCRV